MSIEIDFKKSKVNASYKTIYLKNDMIDKINKIANKNDTSFNNIVVNMIEYCLQPIIVWLLSLFYSHSNKISLSIY